MKNNKRNIAIAKHVLSGASCGKVAKLYSISSERVRQIVAQYCRTADAATYSSMPRCKTINLPWLRKNMNQFIRILSEANISYAG